MAPCSINMRPAPHSIDIPTIDLFRELRIATGLLHRNLESDLALLAPPVTKSRFVWALAGFAGFHRVWEAALESQPDLAACCVGRSRLRLAESDLAQLGMSPRDVARLPGCQAAAALLRTPEIAMGSMYVMEGSTLGGEAISRALRRQDWLPAAGLSYFSPPQRDVRGDWVRLREWATANHPVSSWPAIICGACETFTVLNAWLMAQPRHE
jgi:heme oxygenase